jgi:hypothetical protein
MNQEGLTKTLSLLIKLEWGVDVKVDSPFIFTKSKKGQPITIGCTTTNHNQGVLPKIDISGADYLFVLIMNKSGNNLVLLNKSGSLRVSREDVSMVDLVQYIIYKNEVDISSTDAR